MEAAPLSLSHTQHTHTFKISDCCKAKSDGGEEQENKKLLIY